MRRAFFTIYKDKKILMDFQSFVIPSEAPLVIPSEAPLVIPSEAKESF
jgi:hypothetical protein